MQGEENVKQRINKAALAFIIAAPFTAHAVPALAQQSVQEFYSGPGKQMRMVIRTTAGGGYDLLGRLVARHMGRFIPGEPQ